MVNAKYMGSAKACMSDEPVLLGAYTGTGHLEEAVGTVVAAHFDGDAVVAADSITLFAEEELVEGMEGGGGGRKVGRGRRGG